MGTGLLVLLNGKKVLTDFAFEEGETVQQVDDRLSDLLSLPRTHRLLLRGKELSDFNAPFSAKTKSTLYIIATSENTVAEVKAAKPDPLLRGFKTQRSKFAARPASASSGMQGMRATGFKSIQTLPGKPNEAKAREILTTLQHDIGFNAVMDARGWTVGCLAEMEAEGKVGVDPVCVLGYNTNKGQSIHLRLRTDDGNGFRPMWKLHEVLSHELAHNVHSEHDKDFYALMSKVAKEAKANNWRGSSGKIVGANGSSSIEGVDPLEFADEDAGPSLNIVRRLGSGPVRALFADTPRRPRPALSLEDRVFNEVIDVDAEPERGTQPSSRDEDEGEDTTMPDLPPSSPVAGRSVAEEGTMPPAGTAPPPASSGAPAPAPHASCASGPASDADSKPKVSAEVEALASMGFPVALATVALRECGGAPDRAADWLVNLTPQDDSGMTAGGDVADGELSSDAYVKRLRSALGKLTTETLTSSSQVAEDALLALHLYVYNLVTRPDDARCRRINSMNAAYGRRVGRHAAGPDVLRAIGFTMHDSACWLLDGSVDTARVWLAKSMLVQELQKVCNM